MNKFRVRLLLAAIMAMNASQTITFAQYQPGERVYSPPPWGTFISIPPGATNLTPAAPLPYFPFDPADVPLYAMADGSFVYEFDWNSYSDLFGGPMDDSSIYGDDPYGPPFGTNDFWVEVVAATNGFCLVAAHNCTNAYCQLQLKSDLPQTNWILGEVVHNDPPTNRLFFTPVPMTNLALFFRAQQADGVISVVYASDALETNLASPINPSGYPGIFSLYVGNGAYTLPRDVTVTYTLSGTAVNGTDYTSLPLSVTLAAGDVNTNVYVQPLNDNKIDFEEPAVMTLTHNPTNNYIIDPAAFTATVWIFDNFGSNIFGVVASDLNTAAGLDFHPTTNALIVSVAGYTNVGHSYNFLRIDTNGVLSPWSGQEGIAAEKKIAIVKETANGFTEGELYFGTDVNGQIGRISPDGTSWTNNWTTLTTNSAGADALLRGGLYRDRSGIFGGNLIAVTGGSPDQGGEVWRIASATNTRLFATITNQAKPHLEGVITLPNDPSKWGPWAGRILTGAESKQPALIHTISASGTVGSFNLGIGSEDFDIIATNQDLYCVSQAPDLGPCRVVKISRTLLTNYWGDLLITQEGAVDRITYPPALYIVHWNSTNSVFDIRRISHTDAFEHVTFAPIDIPSTPEP